MKKKCLALLLVLALVMVLLPAAVQAGEPEPRLEQKAVRAEEAEPQKKSYSITFEQNKGGTITCDKTEAGAFDYVHFNIKADPGYYVDIVRMDYRYWYYHAKLKFSGFDRYSVYMPDGDVKITVTFTKLSGPEHEITVVADDYCKWTLDKTTARHHETIYLTCESASKYYSAGFRSAMTADGLQEVERYDSILDTGVHIHEFHMPDSDIVIHLGSHRIGPHSITAKPFNDWGTVSLSTNFAYYGEIVQLTILPKPGYRPLYIVPSGWGAEKTIISYAGGNIWNVVMPDDRVELLVSFEESDNPFMDVKEDAFYYDSVMWALEQGITSGTDLSHFAPNAQANRAQVVTFLWRAAGQPEPTVTENPFVDVEAGSFYEKAVLWAVEHGITNGIDATHFGPNENCNRAQVVTFLHRAMGSPEVSATDCPFTDVQSGAWYEAPILWAVENGVTNGMSADTFGVTTTCNRAQVVTFLYRTYVN